MLMEQSAEIHPVKLIAAENDVVIERPLQEVAHVLAHRVRRSLIPLRAFRGLLGRQDVDEAARKIIEFVTRLDVAMQRHAVELGQDIDRAQPGVEAVADRNIDDPILAADRHRRLRPIFGQWKQARSGATPHDDGQSPLRRAWWQRRSGRDGISRK